ncbi:MAG: isochorismatase family cysteine hydrolase [Bacillota bacterium]
MYRGLIKLKHGGINIKSALLVINMTNRFFDVNGTKYLGEQSRDVVNSILEKLTLARKAQRPVIFINDAYSEEPESKKERFNNSFIEELTPLEDEIIFYKNHPNSFNGTSLENIINDLQIKELVIAGVFTNSSIFFTAVEARIRGFNVIIFEDCIIADDKIAHAVFLNEMKEKYYIEIF